MDDIAYLQRTPSNWPSIEKNVDLLADWIKAQSSQRVIHTTLITTITLLNLHHVLDFWSYISKRYADRIHFGLAINLVLDKGSNYGLENVPRDAIPKIQAQLESFKQDVPYRMEYAVEYIDNLLRTTAWADDYTGIDHWLSELQRAHPDKNIKEIYSIYYK
jgi:hypothetical protein